MANQYGYGLVTTKKKFGSGSYRSSTVAAYDPNLAITPEPGTSFGIGTEDFYISAWIQYGDINVSAAIGTKYPLIRRGNPSLSGWEFGIMIGNSGGRAAYPYFSFEGYTIATAYNGSNAAYINPSSNVAFDHWEAYRINGVVHFNFTTTEFVGSGTYRGSLSYNGPIGNAVSVFGLTDNITIQATQPYNAAYTDNSAYVDEFYFAKNINAPLNYKNTGEIDDGGLSTTVFLLHFNNSIADDAGPIRAAASLNSVSTMNILASAQRVAKANLSSISTLTARANEIRQFIDPMISRFTLSATIGKLISGGANLHAAFTLTGIDQAVDRTTAYLSSVSTLSTQPLRIRSSTAQLASTSTFVSTVGRAKYAQVQLNSTTNLNCAAINIHVAQATANLNSSSTLTAISARLRNSTARLNSISTLSSTGLRKIGAIAHFNSYFTLTGRIDSAGSVRQATVDLTSIFTLSAYATTQHIDTHIGWIIDPETTIWKIEPEKSSWMIDWEERAYIVNHEE